MYRITNGKTTKYDGYLATAIMAALAMGLGTVIYDENDGTVVWRF